VKSTEDRKKGKWLIKGTRNKEIGEDRMKTVEEMKNGLLVVR